MANGYRHWFIMGCNLSPDASSSTKLVFGAMLQIPQEALLVVVGDLKSNIAEPEGNRRYKVVAASLSEAVLEEIYSHFLPHRTTWAWDDRTRSMLR